MDLSICREANAGALADTLINYSMSAPPPSPKQDILAFHVFDLQRCVVCWGTALSSFLQPETFLELGPHEFFAPLERKKRFKQDKKRSPELIK